MICNQDQKRIKIETFFGTMIAETAGNPQYPGIVLFVEQEGSDGPCERQLALVECTPDAMAKGKNAHELRLLIWHDEENEDYTDAYTFYQETPPDSPEEIWEKYILYLHHWTTERADVSHCGTTPLSYGEWMSTEYPIVKGGKNTGQ